MEKKKEKSKMTKESFYFTHDYGARNDPKILELRSEYGLEGLGLYWCIVETLAEEEDGYINPKLLGGISVGYGIAKVKLQEYIDFMLKVELLCEDENGYYSERMMKHKKIRRALSNAGKRGANERWGDRGANAKTQKSDGHPNADSSKSDGHPNAKSSKSDGHPNAKERKGKKKKGKENKGKYYLDTYVSLSKATPSTHHEIDYEAIVNFFNDETQGVFGKVMYPISKNRQDSIRARIKDFGLDGFAEMVRKATRSNFLKGDNKGGFVAKFDWMIRPSNFQKIIEGNYENKQQKGFSAGSESSDEEFMLHIQQGLARGLRENKATE